MAWVTSGGLWPSGGELDGFKRASVWPVKEGEWAWVRASLACVQRGIGLGQAERLASRPARVWTG